ncbi:hypothetical protein J1N35_017028 [Gossypium stocksii]|uniref:Reverse transcriptase domain-containing protein n=1 Tax=Gossypium stocksii TaxID=47602 RepID=A0A9D4A5U2_9ROSI|nr:hypothetical protein J1N35_017028 [Gossypium stocksii]
MLQWKKGIFQYHPKCHQIKLTRLCFADNLLIFCKGTLGSVIGVQSVFDHFYLMSGLTLNAAKILELESIQSISGIRNGELPVRYLGVPLVTRKLSETDCQPLVDKIQARIRHSSAKNLSFAGRLQLIQAVLFSTCNYWYRQLILPKSVLQRINQLRSRFFWKGADASASGLE